MPMLHGICDDVDDCVIVPTTSAASATDLGAIYECGCSDIPEGDCDCDGNQLDALGVCGIGRLRPLQRTPMPMASVTTETTASVPTTSAASATDLVPFHECGSSDIPEGDMRLSTETSLTPSASVVATAQRTPMPMASVTTFTTASVPTTSAASATDLVPSTSADALTSPKETATATETSLTPSACVVATAQRTPMPMASVTTKTTASAPTTSAASATDQAPSTSVVALTSPKEPATAIGNQLNALGVCGGDCAADADADGICDDEDDCVGAYDECDLNGTWCESTSSRRLRLRRQPDRRPRRLWG